MMIMDYKLILNQTIPSIHLQPGRWVIQSQKQVGINTWCQRNQNTRNSTCKAEQSKHKKFNRQRRTIKTQEIQQAKQNNNAQPKINNVENTQTGEHSSHNPQSPNKGNADNTLMTNKKTGEMKNQEPTKHIFVRDIIIKRTQSHSKQQEINKRKI